MQAGVAADACNWSQRKTANWSVNCCKRNDAIDLVVPRGGEGLIKSVVAAATMPVVKHDKGVCSLYVHAEADLTMATTLVMNAKTQRPGVCNAIENLVVDATIAAEFIPVITEQLSAAGVEVRIDPDYRHSHQMPLLPMMMIGRQNIWTWYCRLKWSMTWLQRLPLPTPPVRSTATASSPE